MTKALRPIGLALLAAAIVGAILVPTRADRWNARAPLAQNLQNAAVIVRHDPSAQWMQQRVVVVSAGDAFAGLAALALAGVGLLVFAPRGTRP